MKRFAISFACIAISLSAVIANARTLSNLVCFVRFADQTDQTWTNDSTYYDTFMNDTAADANSVYNYFSTVSYGSLQWKSVIVGQEYTDEKNRTYFCKYNETTAPDGYTNLYFDAPAREQLLVQRLAAHLDSTLTDGVILDGDNDGYIDNMTIILLGNSAISSSNLLWPHNDKMRTATMIKGSRVKNYLVVFDKANGYKSLSPIKLNTGVVCHEMMHSLNAYDLYSNGSLGPVNKWDLMSDNQVIPQGMTAYMGMTYGGWLSFDDIIELTEDGVYTINPLHSPTKENIAYRIHPDKTRSEYFIIEYRRKSSSIFEQSLPSEGLLIYRVKPGTNGNLTSSTEFEVYVYRPGGSTTSAGVVANAPLSANYNRTTFGTEADTYTPFYSDGTKAQFTITEVSGCDDMMSFRLNLNPSGIEDAIADRQVVKRENYTIDGKPVVDANSLTSGIYISRITYSDGTVKTEKIIR